MDKDEDGEFETHCNEEGVPFVDAKTSCALDDFGDAESSSKLKQLFPAVDDRKVQLVFHF